MRKEFQLPVVVLLVLSVSMIGCKVEVAEGAVDSVNSSEEIASVSALDAKLLELEKVAEKEVLEPDSALLAKVEYFPKSRHMALYFQRDPQKAYLYRDVPAEVWNDFKVAPSKGRFFADKIRGQSQYQIKLSSNSE